MTAQDQTLCTRNIRNVVYGENVQSICCICGAADETVANVVSECSKLAPNGPKMIRWKLRGKWGSIKQENGIYTSQKRF